MALDLAGSSIRSSYTSFSPSPSPPGPVHERRNPRKSPDQVVHHCHVEQRPLGGHGEGAQRDPFRERGRHMQGGVAPQALRQQPQESGAAPRVEGGGRDQGVQRRVEIRSGQTVPRHKEVRHVERQEWNEDHVRQRSERGGRLAVGLGKVLGEEGEGGSRGDASENSRRGVTEDQTDRGRGEEVVAA